METFKLRSPETPEEFRNYFHLRWLVLREPWKQPAGTEQDDREIESFHLAVFSDDQKVLACGRLQLNSPQEGQIRFMAVHPDHQHQGLGKLIMQGLEKEAKQRGATEMILQARENAIEFYKSCGYQIKAKTFLLFDSVQHYLMEKELS